MGLFPHEKWEHVQNMQIHREKSRVPREQTLEGETLNTVAKAPAKAQDKERGESEALPPKDPPESEVSK